MENFTECAVEAMEKSLEISRELGSAYVGSEHLLLGLLRVGSGVAATVLNNNGITAENIEQQLKNTIGSGTPTRLLHPVIAVSITRFARGVK